MRETMVSSADKKRTRGNLPQVLSSSMAEAGIEPARRLPGPEF
jgi:hypothetical protein